MSFTPIEDDPRVPLYYQYESAEDCFAREFEDKDVDLRQPYATVMTIMARSGMDERLSLIGLKSTTNLVCEDNYEMYDIQKAIMKLVEFGVVSQTYDEGTVKLHDSERTRLVRNKVK